MPYKPNNQHCKPEEAADTEDGQVPRAEQEEEATATTSSSASSTALIQGTSRKVPVAVEENVPLDPQGAPTPPVGLALNSQSQLNQGSGQQEQNQRSRQVEQNQSSPQREQNQGSRHREVEPLLNPRAHVSMLRRAQSLVPFLILKYRMRESTTKAEMLNTVVIHHDHFFEVFSRASEYMQLVFGIEVIEVDPSDHCYFLIPAAGLTYDGMLDDVVGMPKTGLLIIILGIIFMENDCASEQSVWDTLSVMGVYPQVEHYIYGDPQKLITENFVQEQYLEYRMVPNSDPARYQFLWGPRAHAETTKMRILKHWVKFSGSDISSYPNLREQAMRQERNAQA
ncbi:melanoma-associated antigen 12-like [Perognathus longimembris pacificus]|uniref:melanoma-associated antigen 12-like n=1 Tax=Perognathus longimembris pacificus TaxID=214514 RepID=UPI00201862F0|nr:melanoma-associated antigen 12-like [Perognathus longimembris pacificus]